MSLLGLTPILDHAAKNHYAVGAFNYCNAETAQATAEEAVARKSPLMYITGPWELPLLGPRMLVEIVTWLAKESNIPVCLHLDHSESVDEVRACIEAGFPSVMIDASKHDFEENIRITKLVVGMAHARGVTVEAELGAVGKVDDATPEGSAPASLTDPAQAAEFVERTGIDALAVAIGNAHGIYTQMPSLDFERLQAIRDITGLPIVLHGGSGTPSEQLKRAIDIGISKVNVASEISRAYLNAIRESGCPWYAHAMVEAKGAIREVVGRWMVALGSVGKSTGGIS